MKLVLLFSLLSLIFSHQISSAGLNLIKKYEGCYLTAYKCPAGVWTIGYGTTSADKDITGTDIYPGMTITQQQADEWLRLSVNKKYGPKVDKFDGTYNWNQNEFDALTSFAYNIGSIDELVSNGSLQKSKIPDVMLLYVNAGGKKLDGLVRRRNEERELYLSGGGGSSDDDSSDGESGGGSSTSNLNWLPEVTGYSRTDSNNGYAGVFGRAVTALRVSGGQKYRVHLTGGGWLPPVTGNNPNDYNNGYAGVPGKSIDGVAISGGIRYQVHIKGGNWLPEVTGYDTNDGNNGYAGILGKTIDAVMIKGRTYATAY